MRKPRQVLGVAIASLHSELEQSWTVNQVANFRRQVYGEVVADTFSLRYIPKPASSDISFVEVLHCQDI